jgi:hypothetical protein
MTDKHQVPTTRVQALNSMYGCLTVAGHHVALVITSCLFQGAVAGRALLSDSDEDPEHLLDHFMYDLRCRRRREHLRKRAW